MNKGQEGPLQGAQGQGLWCRATEGAVEAFVLLCVQGKSVFGRKPCHRENGLEVDRVGGEARRARSERLHLRTGGLKAPMSQALGRGGWGRYWAALRKLHEPEGRKS